MKMACGLVQIFNIQYSPAATNMLVLTVARVTDSLSKLKILKTEQLKHFRKSVHLALGVYYYLKTVKKGWTFPRKYI